MYASKVYDDQNTGVGVRSIGGGMPPASRPNLPRISMYSVLCVDSGKTTLQRVRTYSILLYQQYHR